MFMYVCTCVDFRYAAFCKSDSEIWPISEITVTVYMVVYMLRFSCVHTHIQTYTHLSARTGCHVVQFYIGERYVCATGL